MGEKCKKVCMAALLCLFWTLWQEKETKVFLPKGSHALEGRPCVSSLGHLERDKQSCL